MYRLYVLFGLVAAFDLSTEFGYLALAVVAIQIVHKKMKAHGGHK